MTKPNVVSHEQWTEARKALLKKEKEFSRLRDEMSDQIRALPWETVERDYVFDSADGQMSLADLFGPHSQLIVYHFMLGPDWDTGCKSCSFIADHLDPMPIHLEARDTAFAMVSRADLGKLEAFKKRMGWHMQWVSSINNDFNFDYQVSMEPGDATYNYAPMNAPEPREMPGLSVFAKDEAGRIYHTYSNYGRGLEDFMTAYRLLDVVPKGRDEDSDDYGMMWLRLKDEYA